jgi:hypothetical protein
MINFNVPLPNLSPGEHTIEVKYVDKNEKTNGPYTLKFSTIAEQLAQVKMSLNMTAGSWLSFRDYQGKVLLYFTHLLSYRAGLKEIRYSLNSDKLDQTFKFKPTDEMFGVGDELPFIYVPADTQFASVQITYKDGTISPAQKVLRSNSQN